jgi:hypothetical protein
VRSPAFGVDLRGRDATSFVRKVKAEAIKIVGKYAPKTETLRSWNIHGSNARLNHVFELNHLSYDAYRRENLPTPLFAEGSKQGPWPMKAPYGIRLLVLPPEREN